MTLTPPLQLETARDITTAIGRDLIAQDCRIPDLEALTAAAETTPGRQWISKLSDELDDLGFLHLQQTTARQVLSALCDDLHSRQVPADYLEARITVDLETSAQHQTPTDWLLQAGDAWEDTLALDARADAADDWELHVTTTGPVSRDTNTEAAFYAPRQH